MNSFIWTTILLISVSCIPVLVVCVPQIPGPHFPIAAGAPGDEIINTGTVPVFLSYTATDSNGNVHEYVPVYTAIMTDAGESTFKDVRQNIDKTITINGDGTFWCAFGHPIRQFAYQDKYKWDIIAQGIKDKVNTDIIPLQPLIRSFLVESDVVSDIMTKATTENFNKITGTRDENVDGNVATNQFGISPESRTKLEKAALPGSLITYVEDLNSVNGYDKVKKTWGEVKDVAELKRKFNVPTQVFTSAELSKFITAEIKQNTIKANLANSDEFKSKFNGGIDIEWETYASFLKSMEDNSRPAKPYQLTMYTPQSGQISEYPVSDFADINNVKNLIAKQTMNSKHIDKANTLLDSFGILRMATEMDSYSPWTKDVFVLQNKNLFSLKNQFIKECVNFIEGHINFKSMKKLKNEMIKNKIDWTFSPSADEFKVNLKNVLSMLKKQDNFFEKIPFGENGEKFTKQQLFKYYKDSLTQYIQSKNCKLSKDNKNLLVKTLSEDKISQKTLEFTDDIASGSKFVLGVDESKHIIMPGHKLSIEFIGHDIDFHKVSNALSKVFDSTMSNSVPQTINFDFPDTVLETKKDLMWKKLAVQTGDYVRATSKVQAIEFTFKNAETIKYDMVSHIIDNGQTKETPFIFEKGYPVIDNHIASYDLKLKLKGVYKDLLKETDSFRKLQESKFSGIKFVPTDKGFFLSNKNNNNVLKSPTVDEYKNKQFKQQVRNEIIIKLASPDAVANFDDQNQHYVRTAVDEASDMLESGYRQKKNKDNVLLIPAMKEGNSWNILLPSAAGDLENVRITIVGHGDASSEKIAGHQAEDISNLIREAKTKLNIKEHGLEKVSIVACNPETDGTVSTDNTKKAIDFAQIIAKENKVSVSTRAGYVKVDEKGHKWYSATKDGEYHRQQVGDVYLALWKGDTVIPVIEKNKANSFLQDPDMLKSGPLDFSKTVSNEAESDVFKNGWNLKKELDFDLIKTDMENKPPKHSNMFDNPKFQKRLQKVGNIMSKYGMLQTATFLINAEKCKKTNYSSKEACEARKHIAIISLSQEAVEIAGTASKAIRQTMKTTSKTVKASTTGLKSFGKAVLRNPLKGLPVLGVGLDIASLGLDIYDLVRAKTPTEKGIAGTSLALSSLSLIATTTSLVAGIAGATAVAAVAGPAAIVVGIVSFAFNIGVTIWQTIQYENAQILLVNEAAKVFENVHSLYDQPWYDCKGSTLLIKPGVAVKSINLVNDFIEANSDYLCETRRKDWKTHFRLYPLLLGSQICDDYSSLESNCYCENLGCSGLINMRSGMDIYGTQNFYCGNVKTIVLNTAHIMLLDYSYTYFNKYDPVIGLGSKDPASKFQNSGHNLASMIDHNNAGFDYYYHFCWDKYAIINSIWLKRKITSVTEVDLDIDHVQIVIPEFNDTSLVKFSLTGFLGSVYSVYVSDSCYVQLKTKSVPFSVFNNPGQTVWKIIIDIELVEISHKLYSRSEISITFKSTEINIGNMQNNQIVFVDKNNIVSVLHHDKRMLYIVDIPTLKFPDDMQFLQVLNRYIHHDFIDLALTYTPVKNLRIHACSNKIIPKTFVSVKNYYSYLHFTSEYPGKCSGVLNTDASIHLVKDEKITYISPSQSLVWKTHIANNSLHYLVILPCHSQLGSNVSYSDSEGNTYITQIINLTQGTEVRIIYRMVESRLYMLSISSHLLVSWEDIVKLCYRAREQIFSNLQQLEMRTSLIMAGENDLTFVNISNNFYWVEKRNKNVARRIFPNLNTHCDAIDLSIKDGGNNIALQKGCTNITKDDRVNQTQIYHFLCMSGNNHQTFVQLGNNKAKRVNLDYQQIYFEGNDIYVKNHTNVFSFDDDSPSKVCLYEYEMDLPYKNAVSVDDVMIQISQQYDCIESKVKLRFKKLVGWFDYEEMTTIIIHKFISTYKLEPIGTNIKSDQYFLWDTVNGSLFQQKTANSSVFLDLIAGNMTEEEYENIVEVPQKLISNVQEVNYDNGRIYVYTTSGATYFINEHGEREILAVTDLWFASHPQAELDLERETNKEMVIYRADLPKSPSNTRCKRSSSYKQQPTDNFFIYHIRFGLVFDIDLEDSVFIGSNHNNMSVFVFHYNTGTLQELDKHGTVIGEDYYDIVHRIGDRTLVIESNSQTISEVPPLIDNIKTVILGTSDTDFVFNLTELYWANIDEILISDTSHALSIHVHMMPCDYDLKSVDDRVFLLDYGYRKKLIIPNAENRSKNNLINFYVCGEHVQLHTTNSYVIHIIASVSAFLFIMTVMSIVIKKRKCLCQKYVDKNKEDIDQNDHELQTIDQITAQAVKPCKRQQNEKKQNDGNKDNVDAFIPNKQEIQHILQSPVQSQHCNVVIQKATMVTEFKENTNTDQGKGGIYKHRILKRHDAESFM